MQREFVVYDYHHYIYCVNCEAQIARIEDYIPDVYDIFYGGYFNTLKDVLIDQPMYHQLEDGNILTAARTYCIQCNSFIGWRLIASTRQIDYFIQGRFFMKISANAQVGGANAQVIGGANAHVGGANAQVIGGANAQVIGGANAQVIGGANAHVGGTNAQVIGGANAQVIGGANAHVGGANAQVIGGANAQVIGGANAQVIGGANAHVGGTNAQVIGGANAQVGGPYDPVSMYLNDEEDGGSNDQDGAPPMK